MKKQLFTLIFCLSIVLVQAQTPPRPGTEEEKNVTLPISVFQSNQSSIVFRSGVPLNDEDAERVINALKKKDEKFKDWLNNKTLPVRPSALDKSGDKNASDTSASLQLNSHRAVIIVQHQFNPKKLNAVAEDKEKAGLCASYCALKDDTTAIRLCLKSLDCVGKCAIPDRDKLDFIRYLEARRDSDVVKMNALETAYKSVGGSIVEMDPIVSYIYHFDGSEKHSDYLLGVDDMYVILVGGKTDIAASSISTKRTANRNESDFAAAGKLATSLFTGDPELLTKLPSLSKTGAPNFSKASKGKALANLNFSDTTITDSVLCKLKIEVLEHIIDSLTKLLHPPADCELQSKYETPVISATLLHLKRNELYLPGDVNITPLGKTALTFNLHARQWVGVQAGMFGSNLALRNYSLVNDTLTVSVPFEKTKWDALPFIVVQLYPGRDIDRLSPIRLRNRNSNGDEVANFFRNRFGVYGGIRLSKQPVQTLALGLSFALGPNVNVHYGYMWNRTLQARDPYYIGHIQDEKRLEEFAKTIYLPTVSFGISVSPGIYKDWFGK